MSSAGAPVRPRRRHPASELAGRSDTPTLDAERAGRLDLLVVSVPHPPAIDRNDHSIGFDANVGDVLGDGKALIGAVAADLRVGSGLGPRAKDLIQIRVEEPRVGQVFIVAAFELGHVLGIEFVSREPVERVGRRKMKFEPQRKPSDQRQRRGKLWQPEQERHTETD